MTRSGGFIELIPALVIGLIIIGSGVFLGLRSANIATPSTPELAQTAASQDTTPQTETAIDNPTSTERTTSSEITEQEPVVVSDTVSTSNSAKISIVTKKCTFDIPSFFGDRNYFEAIVTGNDFIATEISSPNPSLAETYLIESHNRTIHRTAKIGKTAYYWYENESGTIPSNLEDGFVAKFDYNRVRDSGYLPTNFVWDSLFTFVEVPKNANCTSIPNEAINVPKNITFEDATTDIIESLKDSREKELSEIKTLPFGFYLPVHTPTKTRYFLSAKNQGYSDPNTFSIGFSLSSGTRSISITESKVSIYFDPPQNCREIQDLAFSLEEDFFDAQDISRKVPCNLLTTTSEGISIYTFPTTSINYLFKKGDTVINLSVHGDASTQYKDVQLPIEEIRALVSSFTRITPEAVLTLAPY